MVYALKGNSNQQLRFSGDLSQCGKGSLCPELTSNTEAWKYLVWRVKRQRACPEPAPAMEGGITWGGGVSAGSMATQGLPGLYGSKQQQLPRRKTLRSWNFIFCPPRLPYTQFPQSLPNPYYELLSDFCSFLARSPEAQLEFIVCRSVCLFTQHQVQNVNLRIHSFRKTAHAKLGLCSHEHWTGINLTCPVFLATVHLLP